LAGIYFHIPFCHRACSYCDFHFSTSLKAKKNMIDAMKMELINRLPELKTKVKTIYFGGGTPSILKPEEIKNFIKLVNDNKSVSRNAEITLECNPEDLNENNLKQWLTIGINRLSIGVQSFNEFALKTLNRAHTKDQAIKGIKLARELGFNNISLDLIFSIPGMEIKDLKFDINQLLDLDPDHISCYQLTIEPRTALAYQVKNNSIKLINDELSRDQFLLIHDAFTKKGYLHYEISNFAKPGYESKHNSAYWTRENYLGIGPSAHSFINNKRRWNVSNNAKYINNIESSAYFNEEELSSKDMFNELIMTGIRTKKGLKLATLTGILPASELKIFLSKINRWEANDLATIKNGKLVLTPKSWLISDMLATELFWV
jgi:oxygen-independent coproporphyrinogen-3 oxidase